MKRILLIILVMVLLSPVLSSCDDAYLIAEGDIATEGSSPLTRAAADTMTIADFRRCFGVGYSYDAIWGAHCNPRDVHSRVINLDALRGWEQEESWHMPLFSSLKSNEATVSCTTGYSHSDYTQKTTFYADADAKLILFNGTAEANVQMLETGEANNFFCKVDYEVSSMELQLAYNSVASLISREGRTDLLTPNFRETIGWLEKHHDDATIDSFLVCYGSHVVTQSHLGAVLSLSMNMQRDSLTDIYSNKVLGEAAIAGLLKSKTESEEYKKKLNMLNSASCEVTVRGGDLSKIPNDILYFRFGERPSFSEYVDDWTASVNYDINDFRHCNLEMTDMNVTPIWNFIPNKEVARLVMLRVEGTSEDMVKYSGYQNFANVRFSLPQNVTCKMGGKATTFEQPPITNIIAQGRYVATICREQINLPGLGSVETQVVYPIYNQKVNLSSGYCVYKGRAYHVCWLNNGKLKVEADTLNIVTDDATVYLTYGVPGTIEYANVSYTEGHPVVGYEWPSAITVSGQVNYDQPYYLVCKSGADFLLCNSLGDIQTIFFNGLPNWSFVNGRMVRNKEYYYYWNPNEVSY